MSKCVTCGLPSSGEVNPALKKTIKEAKKYAKEKNVPVAIYKTQGEYFEYLHCPASESGGRNVIQFIYFDSEITPSSTD